MALVTRKYMSRLIFEAERLGLVQRIRTKTITSRTPIAGHPETEKAYQYKIVMAKYTSPKWVRLPEHVAGHV